MNMPASFAGTSPNPACIESQGNTPKADSSVAETANKAAKQIRKKVSLKKAF
ncbi:hypothetical protein [Ruegeria sp. HKCCA4812]|uniref:hypothetical protein n=1 Tax=Ruegeria sp. HKCCA4812 TaxID=2682993 RepID=UPI0020C39C66|nr:hypothetical protein [Ruegeria sp. HKCCA4812]